MIARDKVARVLELYAQGLPVTEIARIAHVCVGDIVPAVRSNGGKVRGLDVPGLPRRPPTSMDVLDRAVKLYVEGGFTMVEASAQAGTSPGTLCKELISRGLNIGNSVPRPWQIGRGSREKDRDRISMLLYNHSNEYVRKALGLKNQCSVIRLRKRWGIPSRKFRRGQSDE